MSQTSSVTLEDPTIVAEIITELPSDTKLLRTTLLTPKILQKLIPQTILLCNGGHDTNQINSPGNIFV